MANPEYDVVVVGSGPAGLQAALHIARRRLRVLVLGRPARSKVNRTRIDNLLGVEQATGDELLRVGREQARGAGAELLEEDATRVEREDRGFAVSGESGRGFRAKAVVLATGIAANVPRIPGERELAGRGVSYCVDCDASLYRGRRVAVVGDGSAAAEGALTLLGLAREVHLVSPGLDVVPELRAEIEASGVIRHIPRQLARIVGDSAVEAVELEGGERLAVEGVFIEQGGKGALDLATPLGVRLDDASARFVVTDGQQATNVPGLFAAGDVTGEPWQVARAMGQGCVAGIAASQYVRGVAGPARAVAAAG
jgi:thioredoxin reductase (NADPH)